MKHIVLLLMALSTSPAIASGNEAEKAARSFGYALQAMGWCKAYSVNLQTEDMLNRQYGEPMRGAVLKGSFGSGLQRFMADESKMGTDNACIKAWLRVGPEGTEYPGLLMKNPFLQ